MLQVPLDYHLPIVFSQPLALCYHQTPGFMGESWQWGGGLGNTTFQGALRTGCSDRGGIWLAEHSQAFLS